MVDAGGHWMCMDHIRRRGALSKPPLCACCLAPAVPPSASVASLKVNPDWRFKLRTVPGPSPAQVVMVGYLGSAVACDWGLSDGQESVLLAIGNAGSLVGLYIFGAAADTVGRKRSLLASAVLQCAFGAASAAAPNYGSLVFFRFMHGLAVAGSLSALILFAEMVPPTNRALWSTLMQFWSIPGENSAPSFGALLLQHASCLPASPPRPACQLLATPGRLMPPAPPTPLTLPRLFVRGGHWVGHPHPSQRVVLDGCCPRAAPCTAGGGAAACAGKPVLPRHASAIHRGGCARPKPLLRSTNTLLHCTDKLLLSLLPAGVLAAGCIVHNCADWIATQTALLPSAPACLPACLSVGRRSGAEDCPLQPLVGAAWPAPVLWSGERV